MSNRHLLQVSPSCLAPEDLSATDPAGVIINKLRSIWPKHVTLTATGGEIMVSSIHPQQPWFDVKPNVLLLLDDGVELGYFGNVLRDLTRDNWAKVQEDIGLRDIAEDLEASFTLGVDPPWLVKVKGEERPVYVRWEPDDKPPELHRVEALRIHGRAMIRVSEVSLEHRRLGEVLYSYGEGMVGGKPALVVATEDEGGGKMTLRTRPIETDTTDPS